MAPRDRCPQITVPLRKVTRTVAPDSWEGAGGTGKSPRLNFRITPDLYAEASERAEREGKTVSQLARDALEQYVTK